MEAEYKELGRRIQDLRLRKRISQGDMARKIGFSQTNMSNIEHGRTHPTLKNLFRIRDILGCSMRDFFEDEPEEGNFKLEEILEAMRIMKKIKITEANAE